MVPSYTATAVPFCAAVDRKNGAIKKNPISKPVDINENPIIDFELFEEARLYRPMSGRVYKMLPVETHRGCPFT